MYGPLNIFHYRYIWLIKIYGAVEGAIKRAATSTYQRSRIDLVYKFSLVIAEQHPMGEEMLVLNFSNYALTGVEPAIFFRCIKFNTDDANCKQCWHL